jgi:hypothetical protein
VPQTATVGGWESAYDAVDALQAAGHLIAGTAAALRGMAARDDVALLRVYTKFRHLQQDQSDVLAQRMLDLLAPKEL